MERPGRDIFPRINPGFYGRSLFPDPASLTVASVEVHPGLETRIDTVEALLDVIDYGAVTITWRYDSPPLLSHTYLLSRFEAATGTSWCFETPFPAAGFPVLFSPHRVDGVLRLLDRLGVYPEGLANFLARRGEWRRHRRYLSAEAEQLLDALDNWDFTRLGDAPATRALDALRAVQPRHRVAVEMLLHGALETGLDKWAMAAILYGLGARVLQVRGGKTALSVADFRAASSTGFTVPVRHSLVYILDGCKVTVVTPDGPVTKDVREYVASYVAGREPPVRVWEDERGAAVWVSAGSAPKGQGYGRYYLLVRGGFIVEAPSPAMPPRPAREPGVHGIELSAVRVLSVYSDDMALELYRGGDGEPAFRLAWYTRLPSPGAGLAGDVEEVAGDVLEVLSAYTSARRLGRPVDCLGLVERLTGRRR